MPDGLQPNCFVCNRADDLDSHHITPIAYNGPEDGPQIMLCARCHRNVHKAANRVYKPPKNGKAEIESIFEEGELNRASVLIRAIVSARIRMESSGRAPNTLRRMQLEIPHSLHLALTRKKQDLGFTSFNALVIEILKAFVNK